MTVLKMENDSFLKIFDDDEQFVDLGLPSGKLWMKHPLGMNSDTDVENVLYFQWGSKKGYKRRERYGFSKENCDYTKTEWNFFENNVKIPSEYDFKELMDGSKYSVETINGIKGMNFISIYNENHLFMPFIGYRSRKELFGFEDSIVLHCSSHTKFFNFAKTFCANILGLAYTTCFANFNDGCALIGII